MQVSLQMTTPWVEQYRPRDFAQVFHQEQAVEAFKQCVRTGQLPHLLLFGPQGTGKTTCIQALGHQLFGPLFYKERVHEINASSDRGVAVIRERVKPLAQRKISQVKPADYNYPVPALQLIVLEEADALTRDAQAALRRIIEDCSDTTRLALLCNYPSQLIGPIVSRCAKFRFAPLPDEAVAMRLNQIAEKENIVFASPEDQTAVLMETAAYANGDMRKAVTSFQMLCQTADIVQGKTVLSRQTLADTRAVHGSVTLEFCTTILSKITNIESENEFLDEVESIISLNLDCEELADGVYQVLIKQENLPDRVRVVAAQEYQKFGAYIARRCGERMALFKFLSGVRVALRLKQ